MKLTRRYRFSASHRLASPQLSDEENRAAFGKCANPYGHGHDYLLEVTVAGEPEPLTGQLVHPPELDRFVDCHVLTGMHLKNLNVDVPEFQDDLVPTSENVARVIHERLSRCWRSAFPQTSAQFAGIRLHETRNNVVALGTSLVEGQKETQQ